MPKMTNRAYKFGNKMIGTSTNGLNTSNYKKTSNNFFPCVIANFVKLIYVEDFTKLKVLNILVEKSIELFCMFTSKRYFICNAVTITDSK